MNNKSGFTLLEMTIVLLVAGIVTAIGIMAYDIYSKNQKYNLTWKNMESIRNALAEYQIKTGSYPCPADPTLGPANPGYGVANCIPCLGCVVTIPGRDANNDGADDQIIFGAIPLTTLITTVYSDNATQAKISINQIHDGWDNKIMYVISRNLTSGLFKPTYGALEIVDENNQSLLQTANTAHYALFSYGQDGAGGYPRNGGPANACTPGLAETQNCNFGTKIVDGLISMGAGATYYDDLVQYITWTATNMWSYSTDSPGTIYNTDLGFVGMGMNDPTVALDVGGRVQAIGIYTKQFCDSNGQNCYDPEKIGGTDTTMDCNDPNMAVKQIGVNATGINGSLNAAQPSVGCQRPFPNAAAVTGACPDPATQFMYGYSTEGGGKPLCWPP